MKCFKVLKTKITMENFKTVMPFSLESNSAIAFKLKVLLAPIVTHHFAHRNSLLNTRVSFVLILLKKVFQKQTSFLRSAGSFFRLVSVSSTSSDSELNLMNASNGFLFTNACLFLIRMKYITKNFQFQTCHLKVWIKIVLKVPYLKFGQWESLDTRHKLLHEEIFYFTSI